MLETPLTHPEILAALARAGHGSQVLIADGNYPASTTLGPSAQLVSLNLRPGLLSVPDVLEPLAATIPIEAAHVMATLTEGPYAVDGDPPAWADYRRLLRSSACRGELATIERMAFYEAARSPDVALVIQTGDQNWYANLLLTIAARQP